jgi:hypothetical protein
MLCNKTTWILQQAKWLIALQLKSACHKTGKDQPGQWTQIQCIATSKVKCAYGTRPVSAHPLGAI